MPKVRWKNDRIKKKKTRDKRQAVERHEAKAEGQATQK